ncbi:hypothetical protein [Planctomycetes bacterium K23_9]|uniref:Uncharacterized protein n=1 Tax=Stieleria marina TaxID=1930275 RepID=A0A517P070_9BACT|nr:hypothetical protein K239x_47820 [Planctomycetes bacterium K23_9]
MAINEHDREDLLRDGRAMPLRGETVISGTEVVIGFRSNNQMSVYCGADPVYQFNADGEVRRVFHDGHRYAAQQGKLVLLQRNSKGGRVSFESIGLSNELERAILDRMQEWLLQIQMALDSDHQEWKVGAGDMSRFLGLLGDTLHGLTTPPKIATQPAA